MYGANRSKEVLSFLVSLILPFQGDSACPLSKWIELTAGERMNFSPYVSLSLAVVYVFVNVSLVRQRHVIVTSD